jgi:hypothetical protein
VRDVLIMQDALDRREAYKKGETKPADEPAAALLFATLLNQQVPQRYRRSDSDIIMRIMRYEATPKRTLLKQLYRDWRPLNANMLRRGMTLPPLQVVKKTLEQFFELLAESCSRQGA